MKLQPASVLTLSVDPSQSRQGTQLLDWVTAVAAANAINVASIDCISEPPAAGAGYSAALLCPVLPSGRLDQEVLLSLPAVKSSLTPGGLLLPFKLELWVKAVHSENLARASHLNSDENVSGFKIADQVVSTMHFIF